LNLAGHTTVGECCFLGIGTTTVDGVKLGALTRSAAGSVITKDNVGNELLAGVPAVVKKRYDS
jgi:acetyltransferase-like isoleucine patch superfamily enzyme